MTKLVIENLNYRTKERLIYEEASLNVDFETLFLKGHNGCGKSTLLNLIFYKSKQYNILFDGQVLSPNDIVYIKQELDLFDELKVKQNLALLKFDYPEYLQYIYDNKLEDKRLGSLSGGERQIVNICLGLATGGKVVLIDEPFNNLSVKHQAYIESLICNDKRPKIIVSHKASIIKGQNIYIKRRKFKDE